MKKFVYALLLILFFSIPALAQFGGGFNDGGGSGGGGGGGGTECSTSACNLNSGTTLGAKGVCLADGTHCLGKVNSTSGDVLLGTPDGNGQASATIQPLAVSETKINLADTTTGDASTSKHGFVPKLPGNANVFYNGNGGFTTPPGGGEGGSGDVVGPTSASDGGMSLYDGVTGKLLKQATFTGLVKATSGVPSAAVAGTDYLLPNGSGTGLSGVAKTSGSYTDGNFVMTDSQGRHVDSGVAPPAGGVYGNVNGVETSADGYLMAFSDTTGHNTKQTGCHVTGAGKDELICKKVTAETLEANGGVDNKFGNTAGGDDWVFDHTTGLLYAEGDAAINWDTVNQIKDANINWNDVKLYDTHGVNWTALDDLVEAGPGGGSVPSDTIDLTDGLNATQTSVPTIAAGAAAGSSPTIQYQGSNASGLVYLYTGSSTTTGTVATVTFSKTYSHYPPAHLDPANDNARDAEVAGAKPYLDIESGSTTTAVFKVKGTALTAGTKYEWVLTNIGR